MKHKWIIWVLAVFLLAFAWLEHRTGAVRVFLRIFGTPVRESLRRQRFDSVAWKSPRATTGDYSLRSRMVDDLLSRRILIGKNKKQILALLGKPDSEVGNQFQYSLGWERGWLKIDGEILVITLDSKGTAIKAETSVT